MEKEYLFTMRNGPTNGTNGFNSLMICDSVLFSCIRRWPVTTVAPYHDQYQSLSLSIHVDPARFASGFEIVQLLPFPDPHTHPHPFRDITILQVSGWVEQSYPPERKKPVCGWGYSGGGREMRWRVISFGTGSFFCLQRVGHLGGLCVWLVPTLRFCTAVTTTESLSIAITNHLSLVEAENW
jgi:hypothetical protein